MARVRCLRHGPPVGEEQSYVLGAAPAGDGSAVVCGQPACAGAGVLWFDDPEAVAYTDGERTFGLGLGVRLRASDWIVWAARTRP